MNSSSNNICIVVVTYNRLEMLKECIESLREQTYKNYSVLVVNNGSTDGTEDWLCKQDDLIVLTQENVGGAGGFFSGIKFSCEKGYKYSWIMDDDVICASDALEKLMDKVDTTPGFLCSQVFDTKGNVFNVPEISLSVSPDTGYQVWGERLTEGMIRVSRATFVSVLFNNDLVRELGLPYKEYFIWGDDTEFTTRISKKYPSYMCAMSKVVHKRANGAALSIDRETDPKRIKAYYYFYRNMIHMQPTMRVKMGYMRRIFKQGLSYGIHGNVGKMKTLIKAVYDAISFNPKIQYPEK